MPATSASAVLLAVTLLSACWTLIRAVQDPMTSTVNYSRHKVIRIMITTRQQMEVVVHAEEDLHKGIDVWKESITGNTTLVDLLVAPDVYEELTSRLHNASIEYDIIFCDLQRIIDEQKAAEEKAHKLATVATYRRRRRRRRSVNAAAGHGSTADNLTNDDDVNGLVGRYANHSEINTWLRTLHSKRPQITELIDIGTSYENRELLAIKIGEPSSKAADKPALWIDAGIHAREWIAPATAIYIIRALVTGYRRDPEVTSLLREYDWYILPLVNPDGYSYSRTVDRLWRKTRSRVSHEPKLCFGVDGNRNFDYQWLTTWMMYPSSRHIYYGLMTTYTSEAGECQSTTTRCRGRQPCENVYAGRRPLSEPETIAVANFVHGHRANLKMYLTLHSYSQLWLTPWGYTADEPNDNEDMVRVASKGVDALEHVHRTDYELGSPALILYAATGGSYDWAKGKEGIKYSYTIELRDKGRYGFMLPANQIVPTGEETWAGIRSAVHELSKDTCWIRGESCSPDVDEDGSERSDVDES